MTNYGQNTENQDSLNTGSGGENEEFVIVEQKKPMNRSVVALILIAAVGGALVYFMYLRGRFNADTQTPQQKQTAAAVSDFMASSDSSIANMEKQLKTTEETVAAFQQNNSAGQVPLDGLRLNPFELDGQRAATPSNLGETVTTADPQAVVKNALSKVQIQMILYSGASSTASIGDRVYKVGDRLDVGSVQFTVKSIKETSVVLTHPTGDYTVLVAQGL